MNQIKVDAFMAQLNHPREREIEALRAIIRTADGRIAESIKWNAPSFYVMEHFATFKLRPADTVQIVFHTGAKGRDDLPSITIQDPAGLLTWVAEDRALATFSDINDVGAKQRALTAIVREWLERVE